MALIEVTIITPSGIVEAEKCKLVVFKTKLGEVGIMANHTPLVAQLPIGEVRLVNDDATEWIAISGGFVEVISNKVIIIAKSAEKASNIDIARAREAQSRAEQLLHDENIDNVELTKARISLQRAINRIRVVESNK